MWSASNPGKQVHKRWKLFWQIINLNYCIKMYKRDQFRQLLERTFFGNKGSHAEFLICCCFLREFPIWRGWQGFYDTCHCFLFWSQYLSPKLFLISDIIFETRKTKNNSVRLIRCWNDWYRYTQITIHMEIRFVIPCYWYCTDVRTC